MPDLLALVIPLVPQSEISAAPYLGKAAHSWFLNTIDRLDPAWTARLHKGPGPRPFTVRPAFNNLERGARPFLRITSVNPQLSAFLLDRWLPSLDTSITLNRMTFSRGPVAQRSDQHPWAGQIRYAELIQAATGHSTRQDRAGHAMDLHFATPTLFRSNNLDVPLPQPTLIFDGLLQKWNRYAPVPLDADLKSWIETHVAVGRYRLHTHLLTFSRSSGDAMPGFQGDCRLVFVKSDPVHRAMVHALAEFAFYAGVGRRTTMGMGQVGLGSRD